MRGYTLVVESVPLPALVIHGGAGAYLKSTNLAQRQRRGQTLAAIVRQGHAAFAQGGARRAVLGAIAALEDDPGFNAGYGSRLQKDGLARLSCSLMEGARSRMSAVYNVQGCRRPSELCDFLQQAADRNLDGEGAARLMMQLGMAPSEVRTASNIARHQRLIELGDRGDREAAIGDADDDDLERARAAATPLPPDLQGTVDDAPLPDEHNRYGTVGAVGADATGAIWASTSTGGRGHEAVGRISDSPTAAGNYACPLVALSATGFGEQIIDLNLCGRIATRMLDGASLKEALARTFDEVAAFGGLLGVIAVSARGEVGYAHTTEACGVAWLAGDGGLHLDQHGRPAAPG